ncbi:MAG TPA: hypothetical protein VM597_24640 [Gemmataceae bacterium]|nr:hypothetical protein [Gemmataceae bacterium]
MTAIKSLSFVVAAVLGLFVVLSATPTVAAPKAGPCCDCSCCAVDCSACCGEDCASCCPDGVCAGCCTTAAPACCADGCDACPDCAIDCEACCGAGCCGTTAAAPSCSK